MNVESNNLRTNSAGHIRWVMWLCLVSLHLITTFHRVSFNVVADQLTAEFTLTGAGLGNLAAAYTYMYVVMQIPGGMLVDRLGPRRIALLTGLLMAAGSLLIGLATGAGLVFFGRLLIGLGGSVILINIFKFQASWFSPAKFATLSGIAIMFSGSGALLGATPLTLFVNIFDWRSAFISVGLLTLLVALICWFVVRNYPIERNNYSSPLSGKSLNMESASELSLKKMAAVISNRRLLVPFVINFGIFGGFIVFSGTWGVSYFVHVYHISVGEASVYMVLAYLGYMLGAPAVGLLSDRIGSKKIPALALTLSSALFWLTLTAWPGGILPLWLFYILSVMLGVGAAATILSFPMAREASPLGYTGSVTAAVNLGVFLGLAVLQPLFGYVLDLGWEGLTVGGARIYTLYSYRLGFLVCFLFSAASLIAALFYREGKPGLTASQLNRL